MEKVTPTIGSTFVYPPLTSPRHIRILEVQHDEDELSPLRCKLRDIDIDDDARIPYAALSYTWGQPNLSEPLILDNAIKLITPNLSGALRRFRHVGRLRWIWVDAVCINQDDDEEKSVQIPFMSSIYHDASYVMVWLGDKSEDVESLKVLRTAVGKGFANIELDDESNELLSTHVSRITQHPWFTRRWIIQEISFNPSVTFHCGYTEMSWQRLAMAVQKIKNGTLRRVASIDSAMSLWDIWMLWSMPHAAPKASKPRVNHTSMPSLLLAFNDFACSDPRDRIYAIMGLRQDTVPIDINYSHSFNRVFVDFSLAYANAKVDDVNTLFWILGQASARSQRRLHGELPSWVPDWRIPSIGELPFSIEREINDDIGLSEDKRHYILTADVLRHPSSSLCHEDAPLRIVWKDHRREDEDFPDFITRVILRYINDPPPGMESFSDEDKWETVKRDFLAFTIPLIQTNFSYTDRESHESIYTLSVNGLHMLPGLIRETLGNMVPNSRKREELAADLQLYLTIRSIFVNQKIRPPLESELHGLERPYFGIAFSDISNGDRVSILNNSLYIPNSLKEPKNLTWRFSSRSGLVLRETDGSGDYSLAIEKASITVEQSQPRFKFGTIDDVRVDHAFISSLAT
ncbi:heterokaryon incompatibility protein-domain-containing protein [Annulohypoxylon moriforme]|nr:heterokaryon incompatibility protein-domain-containing protein [Annulohypoxylon moriforme]